jgi:hypothetical protein
MFDASAHSIPAWLSPVDEIRLVPATTTATELPEIVTDADVFTLASSRTIVTSLPVTATTYVVDSPVTTTVPAGTCVAVLQVNIPPETVTDPSLMLQVMSEVN